MIERSLEAEKAFEDDFDSWLQNFISVVIQCKDDHMAVGNTFVSVIYLFFLSPVHTELAGRQE